MIRMSSLLLPAALAASAVSAQAHVSLEQTQALADSYYKAVLQVPHGCKASPTVGVRVRIPEGIVSVKPQPKPGWKLGITRAKLPQPVDAGHGRMVGERVSEVAWTGGPLADEHFDEFRLVMKLPDQPGTTLYLPVVQECSEGMTRWIEVPDAAHAPSALKEPAPALKLVPRP